MNIEKRPTKKAAETDSGWFDKETVSPKAESTNPEPWFEDKTKNDGGPVPEAASETPEEKEAWFTKPAPPAPPAPPPTGTDWFEEKGKERVHTVKPLHE